MRAIISLGLLALQAAIPILAIGIKSCKKYVPNSAVGTSKSHLTDPVVHENTTTKPSISARNTSMASPQVPIRPLAHRRLRHHRLQHGRVQELQQQVMNCGTKLERRDAP